MSVSNSGCAWHWVYLCEMYTNKELCVYVCVCAQGKDVYMFVE